jgi:hypothetical protein
MREGALEFMMYYWDELKCTCIHLPQSISAVLITMNYLNQYIAALVGVFAEVPLPQNLYILSRGSM